MNTWYILYGGQSVDGLGPGRFCGRTTDINRALEHYRSVRKNPYSTGGVRIVTDTREKMAFTESDFYSNTPQHRQLEGKQ